MSSAALSCSGISYRYRNGRVANDDIALTVAKGEIVCLLGPNGSGKSTLINQLAGLLRPQTGMIALLDASGPPFPEAVRRRMGVIPQDARLFDSLGVREHLVLFGPLKGVSGSALTAHTDELLRRCELESLAGRKVGTLSMGQQRRVMVALALLGDPALLILDEPTIGLDPLMRRSVWALLEKQRASGKALLLTTHYLDEAERLADRVALMMDGRIRLCGTLPELYASVGQTVRLTEYDTMTGAAQGRHYFDSIAQAQSFAASAELSSYSVARVALEDVYIRVCAPVPVSQSA